MKNPYGKSRKTNDPYFTLTQGDWQWNVLKLYKSPEASLKDSYARAFLATRSPYTYGEFELGDGYIKDVPGLSALLANLQAA